MQKIVSLLLIILFIISCENKVAPGEHFQSKKEAQQKKRTVEKNSKKQVSPSYQNKEVTEQQIKDATFKLYVEAIPNNSDIKWEKGNNPRSKQYDIAKDNIRAVCLGVENGEYVFMTLRYFLDFTYPNHNIQGVLERPYRSQKIAKDNAGFISYCRMMRLTLSDVRHTGGGQIKVNDSVSLSLKNDFEITEISSYDLINSYSMINGKQYKDPISGIFTAKEAVEMNAEINNDQSAQLQIFGSHDICLIKVKKNLFANPIIHLGLKNPVETIRVITEKQKNIYGFEFVLLSKEAYKAILHYQIPDEAKESGIYKLALHATAIMAIGHVIQIKLIDDVLLDMFRKTEKATVNAFSVGQLATMGLTFSERFLQIRKKN